MRLCWGAGLGMRLCWGAGLGTRLCFLFLHDLFVHVRSWVSSSSSLIPWLLRKREQSPQEPGNEARWVAVITVDIMCRKP